MTTTTGPTISHDPYDDVPQEIIDAQDTDGDGYVVLYANWKPNVNATVVYNPNGGEGRGNTGSKNYTVDSATQTAFVSELSGST